MDQSNANHLETIFFAALEIHDPEARASYLKETCGQDAELRQRVDQMLAIQSKVGGFMENSPVSFDGTIELKKEILDAGLTAGLREDQAVVIGAGNHSVLKSLSRTLNDVPRVMLRDRKETGRDPIVRPRSKEIPADHADSRYQLAGEIARGGMGAIIKGRDIDLGRDLAIKVLLDSHKDKQEVVQRFIEEAQIGGQLQHPGIVPVYELGQFADQRPFFSMKLVKGETLAELLTVRQDPSEDRAKYLGIFEQVCQTMAYAHSRGVIHRDLKPGNIMVGAFGEVQVMDWGLAKVLAVGGIADEKKSLEKQAEVSIIRTLRSVGSDTPGSLGSQTQMGSVMGTPAYMSPEQALGEVDRLDERTDVFGLGAILCEILTGKPPYVASSGEQVFRLASRGKLDDCYARLAASQADAELLQIVRDAMVLEPDDRLRDAGQLAKRFSSYLQSVESRLRQAEVERHQAITRAEEVRKRQRVMLALAGSIVITIGIGAGAWIWVQQKNAQLAQVAFLAEQERSEERAKFLGEINEKLATARAFRGDGTLPGSRDYPTLVRAFESAQQAQALVEKSNVEKKISEEVRALVNDLEEKVRDQRLAIDLDDAWSKEMEKLAEREYLSGNVASKPVSIHANDGEARVSNRLQMAVAPEAEPLYAQAFAAWGIEPGKTSAEEALRRIQQLPTESQTAVLVALERWQELLSTPSVTQWNSAKWQILQPTEMQSAVGATLTLQNDGSIFVSGGIGTGSLTIAAPCELEQLAAIRLETIPDARLTSGGTSYEFNGDFHLSEFRASLGPVVENNAGRALEIRRALVDFELDADHSISKVFDGDRTSAWEVGYQATEPHIAVFELESFAKQPDEKTLRIELDSNALHGMLGRFRLSVTQDSLGPSPGLAWLAAVINIADKDDWRKQLRREIASGDIAALVKRAESPELLSQPRIVQIRLAEALRQVDRASILNLWKSQVKWLPLKPAQLESSSGATLDVSDDGTIVLNSLSVPCDSYTLTAPIEGNYPTAIRLEFPTHHRRQRGISGWPYCLSEVEVNLVSDPQSADELPWSIVSGMADYETLQRPLSASFDQEKVTFWKANHDTWQPHSLIYWLSLDTATKTDGLMRIRLHSGEERRMTYAPRRFKVFVTDERTMPLAPRVTAISILRRLQRARPGDFWINYALSHALFQNDAHSREEALRFATAAVALRPESSGAHANVLRVLGRGFENMANLPLQQLAIQHARRAKELSSRNLFSNLMASEITSRGLDLRQQPQTAISYFRLALELEPTYVLARQLLAVSLNNFGRPEEAIAEYRKAAEEFPLNREGFSDFGRFLQQLGKLNEAESAYRKALELDPKSASNHSQLATLLVSQGKTEEAQAEERIVQELGQEARVSDPSRFSRPMPAANPDDEIAKLRADLETNPDDLRGLSRLVSLLEQTKQFDATITLLRSRSDELQDKPYFVSRLGTLLFHQNRVDEAIEIFRQSIELGDVNYVSYYPSKTVRNSPDFFNERYSFNYSKLGHALEIQGKLEEAQKHYRRALEYNPFAAESWVGRERNITTNRDELLFRIWGHEIAIGLHPKLVEAHIGMGWALAAQGKAEAARAKFREAIELAPKFAYVQNSLAWELSTCEDERLRDPELAVEVAKRACALAPKRDAGNYWNTLGVAQYYARDYAAALEALQRSIELRYQDSPTDADKGGNSSDWFFIAMAHWRLGDQPAAHEYYDKAVAWMQRKDPSDSELIRFKAESSQLLGRQQEAPKASADKPAQYSLPADDPANVNSSK